MKGREIADRLWCDSFEKADLARAIDAALLAATIAEREACAKIAAVAKRSVDAPKHGAWDRGYEDGRNDAAAAIRARSNTSK